MQNFLNLPCENNKFLKLTKKHVRTGYATANDLSSSLYCGDMYCYETCGTDFIINKIITLFCHQSFSNAQFSQVTQTHVSFLVFREIIN